MEKDIRDPKKEKTEKIALERINKNSGSKKNNLVNILIYHSSFRRPLH